MLIAGIDEVGRGAVAGPMIVCCAVLDSDDLWWQTEVPLVLDSKKYKNNERFNIFTKLIRRLVWVGIGSVSAGEIDSLGITEAWHVAVERATAGCNVRVKILIVDGGKRFALRTLPNNFESMVSITKADETIQVVGAASIVAKVFRNKILSLFSMFYTQYNWGKNVGYCTTQHIRAINQYGFTAFHRKSFRVYNEDGMLIGA